MAEAWSPGSWKQKKARHQPVYPDPGEVERVLAHLRLMPPLVFAGEVERLKEQIALAREGRAFILQGGDCVERFIDCRDLLIANKLRVLLQMSIVLTHGARTPVVRIGRLAGQYTKPRSSPTETVEGREFLTYRGDAVNAFETTAGARTPDPQRLLSAYNHSVATLNYVRAMINGGFADLHHPFSWNLHSIEQTDRWPQYREIVEQILDAIAFMEAFGGADPERLGRIEFFISHEGLHLGYEEALTRWSPEFGRHYNLGAHTLWIGNRTRKVGEGHVAYFRGLANPMGIKIGPDVQPGELTALLDVLDPRAEPGRIMLVSRLGARRVDHVLPGLIEEVRATGSPAAWICDPMHGNTINASGGHKTRSFEAVLEELERTFEIHARADSRLSGIHFELTGEDVTECTGGAVGITDGQLGLAYETWCDPRLNYAQSMEMAFLVSRLLRKGHSGGGG